MIKNIFSSINRIVNMCACRQKRSSFFIEDILNDVYGKKAYKTLSLEPTEPLTCTRGETAAAPAPVDRTASGDFFYDSLAEQELDTRNINLEQRRNTYPLYPTPVKANLPWPHYKAKDSIYPDGRRLSISSDPMPTADQMLRNQLAANRFLSHSLAMRPTYGFHRVPLTCCNPWWDIGGRRKSRQVRFTAAQTGALERRFNVSKYLSPDERRAIALTLKLSDRQVKTWFQNRRAKWRRSTPDAADTGSPPTADESSDCEVKLADDDPI